MSSRTRVFGYGERDGNSEGANPTISLEYNVLIILYEKKNILRRIYMYRVPPRVQRGNPISPLVHQMGNQSIRGLFVCTRTQKITHGATTTDR